MMYEDLPRELTFGARVLEFRRYEASFERLSQRVGFCRGVANSFIAFSLVYAVAAAVFDFEDRFFGFKAFAVGVVIHHSVDYIFMDFPQNADNMLQSLRRHLECEREAGEV